MKYYRVTYSSFHQSYSAMVIAESKNDAIRKYIDHVEKYYPEQKNLTDNIEVQFLTDESKVIK